jgi:carboxylesterase type B
MFHRRNHENCFGALEPSFIPGLFHRAISQSGTGLASWAYAEPEYMKRVAIHIGTKIGCNTTDAKELLECFQKKPATDFVNMLDYEVKS